MNHNRRARPGVIFSTGAALVAGLIVGGSAFAAEAESLRLAKQNACMACHGISNKIVGPAFTDIAARYKDDAGAGAALAAKVKNGSSGAWGAVPMPPQAHVKGEDINTIVSWILAGAK